MEKEFRIANYGVKPPKTRSVIELERNIPDCQAVLLTDPSTAVYSKGGVLYKKAIEGETGKVFCRSSGKSAKIAVCDSVVALFNSEGRIRFSDYAGNGLSSIDTGSRPLRALAFLSKDVICTGGEACRLMVYSIYDAKRLAELSFSEYIDSITANGTHLAVSLSSGEIHIYAYALHETGTPGQEGQKKLQMSLEEVSASHVENPCLLQFIDRDQLFIGLSTGMGYVYSMEKAAISTYCSMHSKGFTKAEVHGDFLITSSLDGRLRVSTLSLKEVSSLYAGAAVLGFNALFCRSEGRKDTTGVQYIVATATGNVIVYRDRWTPEPQKEAPVIRKSGPQNLKEYTRADTTEMHTVPISLQEEHKRGKYGRLMFTFQYRKALGASLKSENLELITGVMDYLHKIDRLITSLATLTDAEISVLAGISVDLLKTKEFFGMADSVLTYCSKVLYGRAHTRGTPICEVVDRALQEIEEEFLVQCTLLEVSEYIKGLMRPAEKTKLL
ncbi:uncharacterized protein NEMAJ01_0405 [Nematocida major]|uniref:uncharacterized protein n=1 Tax=Nematocida major TaxID=1912982 RepID=UPI0020089CC1|nr:uncharacterized protein NEMAJ01_0405 [Nematocida major]KAH9385509.1 hypothetical protein NEMAJ01_0405 [Nematocida major]